jgi:tetratricopeptide (TPR) repeat protein
MWPQWIDPQVLVRLGELHLRIGAHAEAMDKFGRAGEGFARRGFLSKAIGAYARALHAAERGGRWGDAQLAIVIGLTRVYEEEGRTREARAMLEAARARFTQDGRPLGVVAVQRVIVALDPDEPVERVRLGDQLALAGHQRAAADEYAACTTLLLERGQTRHALSVVERLLKQRRDPSHARLAAELYLARAAKGDGRRALKALRICLRRGAGDAATLRLLASALRLSGDAARAVAVDAAVAEAEAGRAVDPDALSLEDSDGSGPRAVEHTSSWTFPAARAAR